MSESYDFLFKFLVIGNAGTGKSCLLHQFIEKRFKDESNHTIGVEFGSKIISVVNKMVKLQIWDTAGQERFRSVTRSYYRGAAGALLVYDITSRETYNALTTWLSDARMLASQNIVIILCGNKKDLDTDREVTFLEASRFAQENELMFLETSALTGENVEEAFVQCARKILNKIESGELDPERMGSAAGHPGVWLLVDVSCSVHRQVCFRQACEDQEKNSHGGPRKCWVKVAVLVTPP
ncbi:ras-related protein Rab-4A [Lates japonicus]|uniref:Ras-related protein Rab-4 n=1 Tax=Lates japonicus TaxID=270547 RepID=A0AAD3MR21_LATJO|nr:ras-related protein Rab-4A [Lates japonicus]